MTQSQQYIKELSKAAEFILRNIYSGFVKKLNPKQIDNISILKSNFRILYYSKLNKITNKKEYNKALKEYNAYSERLDSFGWALIVKHNTEECPNKEYIKRVYKWLKVLHEVD